MKITDASFALSVSAADARQSVLDMKIRHSIAGNSSWLSGDVVGTGIGDGVTTHSLTLLPEFDSHGFVIDNAPNDLDLKVTRTGDVQDVVLNVVDTQGLSVTDSDVFGPDDEHAVAVINEEGPHFSSLTAWESSASTFDFICNCDMRLIQESDAPGALTIDESYFGRLDHPYDFDFFEVDLEKGQSIDARVESMMIDPFVLIGWQGGPPNLRVTDDDSGGGLLGRDADAFFTAPHTGTFMVLVSDASLGQVGSYLIAVRTLEAEFAPPAPTSARTFDLVETGLGAMIKFEGVSVPYTVEFPATWLHHGADPESATEVDAYGETLRGPIISFAEDPNASIGSDGEFSATAHADDITAAFGLFGIADPLSRVDPLPGAVLDIVTIEFDVIGGFSARYLYYVDPEGQLITITIFGGKAQMAEIADLIDHIFSSFSVSDSSG